MFCSAGMASTSSAAQTETLRTASTCWTRPPTMSTALHGITFPSKEFYSKLSASWYRNGGETEFGGDFVDPALDRMQVRRWRGHHWHSSVQCRVRLPLHFRKSVGKGRSRLVRSPATLWKRAEGWISCRRHSSGISGPMKRSDLSLLERGIACLDDFVQSRDYVRMGAYCPGQDHVYAAHCPSSQEFAWITIRSSTGRFCSRG